MNGRFDESEKVFKIAVRELARDPAPIRIGFDRGGGWANYRAGTELHSRILKSRCQKNPNYQSEVYLEGKFSIGDWTASVHGRLDGCVAGDQTGWTIEEFKSCDLGSAGKLPPFVLE